MVKKASMIFTNNVSQRFYSTSSIIGFEHSQNGRKNKHCGHFGFLLFSQFCIAGPGSTKNMAGIGTSFHMLVFGGACLRTSESGPLPTEVYKISWWMGHYGHPCPKRHKGFSNNKWTAKYNLGKLKLKEFQKSQNQEEKPTVRYIDSQGKERFAGNAKLKLTQWLGSCQGALLQWLRNGLDWLRLPQTHIVCKMTEPYLTIPLFRACSATTGVAWIEQAKNKLQSI